MEIIYKKKSSFIPFPLQTLTSEESTLEFYDIYDTSFLKEFDDFSDELFVCHKLLMFIIAIVLWCIWSGILSVSFVKEFGSLGDEPLHVNLFLKFSFPFSSFVSFSIGKGGNGSLCL